MWKILMVLLAMIMISCSASYDSPKNNDYTANLLKEQFFMHVPEIMKMEDFKVLEKNEKEGYLKLRKNVVITENHSVEFNINFNFNDSTRNVNSLVKALINKDNIINTEYYSIDCYREEYKTYFLNALEGVKNYCTKVSFPNPPGN
jgi:hypothetical protein